MKPVVQGFFRFRYTRNLVDRGNGKYNLMALCWGEGHGSAIHDHADAHCFMKMLQGELQEIRFEWPKSDGEVLVETGRSNLPTNGVCYINGTHNFNYILILFVCLYNYYILHTCHSTCTHERNKKKSLKLKRLDTEK